MKEGGRKRGRVFPLIRCMNMKEGRLAEFGEPHFMFSLVHQAQWPKRRQPRQQCNLNRNCGSPNGTPQFTALCMSASFETKPCSLARRLASPFRVRVGDKETDSRPPPRFFFEKCAYIYIQGPRKRLVRGCEKFINGPS